jgi:uncharacterized SAM-binding protein YcdF (DUF218 family)
MYPIKKGVGLLTEPGIIVLLLLLYGFCRVLISRGAGKKGWLSLGLGLTCFYLFTTAPLPNYLLGILESRYQPVSARPDLSEIRYIVVLSSGLRLNDALPPTSQLDEASAFRVMEGVRLFHLMSGAPTLIMTGQGFFGDMGTRMAAFAESLGVPPEKLIAENQALDTHGNAVGVEPVVKNSPFLLVTSAAHMPRSMIIFQKLGMKPLAAPGDFRQITYFIFTDFLPSGKNLTGMESAVHEYLGLAYLYLFPARAGK